MRKGRALIPLCLLAGALWLLGSFGLRAEYDFTSALGIRARSDVEIKVVGCFDTLPPAGCAPIRFQISNRTNSKKEWQYAVTMRSSSHNVFTTTRGTIVVEPMQKSLTLVMAPIPAVPTRVSPSTSLSMEFTGYGVADGAANQYSGGGTDPSQAVGWVSGFEKEEWARVEKVLKDDKSMALNAVEIAPGCIGTDWRALTGFGALFVRTRDWQALPPEARSTILQYVSLGGSLILTHSVFNAQIGPVPDQGLMGFGTIKILSLSDVTPPNPAPEPSPALFPSTKPARPPMGAAEEIASEVFQLSSPILRDVAVAGQREWKLAKAITDIPAPHGLIVTFMILFGLIIGPLNFFVLAPAGARHRLFVTTPAISLVATLLMVGLIIGRDGFGGTGRRFLVVLSLPEERTLSVLQDQVSRTGVLIRSAFREVAGTMMETIPLSSGKTERRSRERTASFAFENGWTSGSWFRSRAVQGQFLMASVPSRARIEITQEPGGKPSAQSLFDYPLGRFYYLDANGAVWTAERLPTGSKVPLEPSSASALEKWWAGATHEAGPWLTESIAETRGQAGWFYAEGEAGPFVPTLGSIKWEKDRSVFLGKAVVTR